MLTPLELGVLRRRFGEMVPPLLAGAGAGAASGGGRRVARGRASLRLLSEKARQEAVLAMVRGEVARVLSLPGGDAVEPDRPLKELGLDSLMAVELRNALGRRAGAHAAGDPGVRLPDAGGHREVPAGEGAVAVEAAVAGRRAPPASG